MSESHEEIFKTIAIRIVGSWHYFNQEGSFSFSLIPSVGASGDVLVTKGIHQYHATYEIKFEDDTAVLLSIDGLPKRMEAIIKVLTNDSLILQRDGTVDILQRMPDMEFANQIIGGL